MDTRQQLRAEIHTLYAREHAELGEAGTYRLLDEARCWDLSGTLLYSAPPPTWVAAALVEWSV